MPVVVVEGVSKKYSRNANSHLGYGLSDLFREIFNLNRSTELRKDEFIAVNDVSFHLNQGDSLALIGRNGSGKTTLLKMMNGLIKLDSGRIVMDGRIQALINLGAGFSPNISGKDNIYNSASLMGLNSRETRRIIDEIVDFSELEEFIDSPVGTYSSGMKARLGFAVAILLRPDILLIDEILGVGDFAFRNKCFVKLHELKKKGVTTILVSHDHTSVIRFCERALWLHKGNVMGMGPANETVQKYLSFLEDEEVKKLRVLEDQRKSEAENIAQDNDEVHGSGRVALAKDEETHEHVVASGEEGLYGPIFSEFHCIDNLEFAFKVNGNEAESIRVHDELTMTYSFFLRQRVEDLSVSFVFFRSDGLRLSAISTMNGDLLGRIHDGRVACTLSIPDFNVSPCNLVIVMVVHEGTSFLYRNIVKDCVVTGDDRLHWELVDFKYEYRLIEPAGKSQSASYT